MQINLFIFNIVLYSFFHENQIAATWCNLKNESIRIREYILMNIKKRIKEKKLSKSNIIYENVILFIIYTYSFSNFYNYSDFRNILELQGTYQSQIPNCDFINTIQIATTNCILIAIEFSVTMKYRYIVFQHFKVEAINSVS